jgi:uncharacterized membrane protein
VTDRPRALIVLIAVFLVGCLMGSAGSYYWLRKSPGSQAGVKEDPRPPVQVRRKLPELLQLTTDQEQRFREIMAESRKQLEKLRIEQAQQIEAVRSETDRKFTAILNEEQKEKFAAFQKEIKDRKKRPSRGGGFESPRQ